MGLWVRGTRAGLSPAWSSAGLFVGLSVASFVTAGSAVAQTASSIVVEGNRRVECGHDPLLFPRRARRAARSRSRSTRASRRCSRPACLPGRALPPGRAAASIVTVVENPVISRIQFEGNKRVKDEQLIAGDPVEAARLAVASARCRPTSSASSRSIAATAATTSASSRRSSTGRTTASISCSRSPKAARPPSRRSISSATAPIRPGACAT